MANKPSFVFVPGNFLPSFYYLPIARVLESQGFETRLVTIPSTGSRSTLTSNELDVVAVREVLEELSDNGEDIIVVSHSYGSIPTCEASKGFGKQERLGHGRSGGVIRLVFVAAWLLQEGENPPEIIERYKMEAPWARFEDGRLFADDPADPLFNDVPADVAAYWSPHITHSDLAAFATPLKYAAWRHIPTTYVLCEVDKCIPTHVQEGMVAVTASESSVRTVRLASGHMPMLSSQEKPVNVLREETASSGMESAELAEPVLVGPEEVVRNPI